MLESDARKISDILMEHDYIVDCYQIMDNYSDCNSPLTDNQIDYVVKAYIKKAIVVSDFTLPSDDTDIFNTVTDVANQLNLSNVLSKEDIEKITVTLISDIEDGLLDSANVYNEAIKMVKNHLRELTFYTAEKIQGELNNLADEIQDLDKGTREAIINGVVKIVDYSTEHSHKGDTFRNKIEELLLKSTEELSE